MPKNSLVFFDMITQECFDLLTHTKFIYPINHVCYELTDSSMIFKYSYSPLEDSSLSDSSSSDSLSLPSPGFRFLLRTNPGTIYHISITGILQEGDEAWLFIESPKSRLIIAPKDKIFRLGEAVDFSLNFQAKDPFTVIGILFKSPKKDYCLSLTWFEVKKVDECLIDPNTLSCPPQCKKTCYVGPPPCIDDLKELNC